MVPFLLARALFLEFVGRLLPFRLMQYHGFNSLASYVAVCGFVGAVPVFVLSGARLSLFLYAFSLDAIKAEVFYFTQGLEKRPFLSGVNFLERPAVLFSLAGLCSVFSYYVSVPVFMVAVFNMFNAYAKIPLTFKEGAVTPMSLRYFFSDGDLGGKDNGLTKGGASDPNQLIEEPSKFKLA